MKEHPNTNTSEKCDLIQRRYLGMVRELEKVISVDKKQIYIYN